MVRRLVHTPVTNSGEGKMPRTSRRDGERSAAQSGDTPATLLEPRISIGEMLRRLRDLPEPRPIQERDEIAIPKRRGI